MAVYGCVLSLRMFLRRVERGGNRRLFLSCVQPCCTNVLAQQWRFKTIETLRSNLRYGV